VRSITQALEQFKLNWTLELSSEKIANACCDCGMKWIESLLNPMTTIQIFMLQILHGDTACNHFGQPGGQKPGCGFFVAHWLVLMHLGTGMITKMLASALCTGDMSKMVELHPGLKTNDLLVGDRASCSFAHLCLLIERGVEALLRINQNMIVDLTAGWPYVIPNRGTGSKR